MSNDNDEKNTILSIPNYNSKGVINTNNISDVKDNDKVKSKRKNDYYDIKFGTYILFL